MGWSVNVYRFETNIEIRMIWYVAHKWKIILHTHKWKTKDVIFNVNLRKNKMLWAYIYIYIYIYLEYKIIISCQTFQGD